MQNLRRSGLMMKARQYSLPSVAFIAGLFLHIEYRWAERTRIIFNYSLNRNRPSLAGFQGNMPKEQFGVMEVQLCHTLA